MESSDLNSPLLDFLLLKVSRTLEVGELIRCETTIGFAHAVRSVMIFEVVVVMGVGEGVGVGV